MDASSSTKATIELFKQLLEILEEENAFDRTGNELLVQFVHPDELQVSYDLIPNFTITCYSFTLNIYSLFFVLQERLPIKLTEEPADKNEIENAIRQTIRYSVKTYSPHFHNQLYAGVDEYGLAGSWLTDMFNTSQ